MPVNQIQCIKNLKSSQLKKIILFFILLTFSFHSFSLPHLDPAPEIMFQGISKKEALKEVKKIDRMIQTELKLKNKGYKKSVRRLKQDRDHLMKVVSEKTKKTARPPLDKKPLTLPLSKNTKKTSQAEKTATYNKTTAKTKTAKTKNNKTGIKTKTAKTKNNKTTAKTKTAKTKNNKTTTKANAKRKPANTAYGCSENFSDIYSIGSVHLGYGCSPEETLCIAIYPIVEINRCRGAVLTRYYCDPEQESKFTFEEIKCPKGCDSSGLFCFKTL